MATTALALTGGLAAGPASAADMMSVGVGGYMQQWFGYASRDDEGQEGGWDTQADTEIHFKGSLESDTGLTFSVHVELEGNNEQGEGHSAANAQDDTEIDESFLRISGEFGQLEMGQRDHGLVRMHYGIKDVGVGLNAGDTQKWIPGTYLETSGHVYSGGDDLKLNYFTPRINGLQVGVSYAPDQSNENLTTSGPNGNDDSSWGAAVNFEQPFGDGTVSLSLGHQVISHTAAEVMYMPGMAPANNAGNTGHMDETRISQAQHAMHDAAITKMAGVLDGDTVVGANAPDTIQDITMAGTAGRKDIMDATSSMMKSEDSTFTNFGVGVGFGAFTFNVAYATRDSGSYAAVSTPMKMTPAEMVAYAGTLTNGSAYNSAAAGTATAPVNDSNTATHIIDTDHMFDHDNDPDTDDVAESAQTVDAVAVNDTANETWMTSKVMENKAADFNVWGVSVTYTDGPMALSLAHMAHENDAGGERNATMLSGSYNLAPGVDWKTSVFAVEDTTSHANVTDGMNEGTAFVTGIALNF